MRTAVAALALPALLLAQRTPAPGDAERVVEAFDLTVLLDAMAAREPNTGEKELSADELRAHQRDEILLAVRRFVEPPLATGDAVEALGSHHIVALVRPEQADWTGAFLEGLANADLRAVHTAKLQLLTCTSEEFDAFAPALHNDVAGRVAPNSEIKVETARFSWLLVGFALDGADAQKRLADLRAAGRTHHNSYMAHLAIQQGSMYGGTHLPVVLRFEERKVHGGDGIVVPIHEELFDGFRYRLQRVPLPDGRVGFGLEAEHHDVREPIETMAVETADGPRTVHLPETVVAEIELGCAVPAGTETIVFARRAGDSYHVVVVEPMKSRPGR